MSQINILAIWVNVNQNIFWMINNRGWEQYNLCICCFPCIESELHKHEISKWAEDNMAFIGQWIMHSTDMWLSIFWWL